MLEYSKNIQFRKKILQYDVPKEVAFNPVKFKIGVQ